MMHGFSMNWKNLNLCSKDYILRNCFPRRHLKNVIQKIKFFIFSETIYNSLHPQIIKTIRKQQSFSKKILALNYLCTMSYFSFHYLFCYFKIIWGHHKIISVMPVQLNCQLSFKYLLVITAIRVI